MNVFKALWKSCRFVLATPRLLAILWITLLLTAAPLGLMMQREIASDIGASRVHLDLRERMDMVWLGEFGDRGGFLGRTLKPVTASGADFLGNLDLLFSGRLFTESPGLVSVGIGYALVWLLILGGVIDRFARGGGKVILSQFLAAAGRYFPRLLALTAVSATGYWGVYWLAEKGFTAIEAATRDVTVEATVLKYYLLAAIPVLLLTAIVMMISDYARIAAVVEERSAWTALGRGARFVVQRPLQVFGLALIVTLAALAIVALRTVATPGVGESSLLGILGVFLIGQLFVASRLALRLIRIGSQLSLYRALRRS